MVRERVDERQLSGAMARPNSKSDQEAHQAAVRNIADQLFAYPTADYPHLRTFVNEPEPEQKIFTNLGRRACARHRRPRVAREAATHRCRGRDARDAHDSRASRAPGRSSHASPASSSTSTSRPATPADAKLLLKQAKIKNVGLRTWRNIAGLKSDRRRRDPLDALRLCPLIIRPERPEDTEAIRAVNDRCLWSPGPSYR